MILPILLLLCSRGHARPVDGERGEIARDDDPGALVHSVVNIADPDVRLTLGDVDGDGDLDLVRVHDDGLRIHLQDAGGAFGATPGAHLPWPAEDLAWTLLDTDGDGVIELAAYLNAGEVRTYALDGAELGPGQRELEAKGRLPGGRYRMSFFRDVDGDGRLDLVLPDFGSFAVYTRRADGSWSPPLRVALEARVDFDLGDPESLDSTFGQRLSIPWFSLEDLDGDGDLDLVAETEQRVFFHLAEPSITSEATWSLDLEALHAGLPARGQVDFDNLLAANESTVDWRIVDLDGEGARDLVLQLGSKLHFYRNGSRTGPSDRPDQVLKASGMLLGFDLRNILGDELPDLQLIRGERLSLAKILRWLVLPGDFDFDLFTYENTGGVFSLRPTRRNRLRLEIPRILAFINKVEDMEEELEARAAIPARSFAFDVDGRPDDVLDVLDGALVLFKNAASIAAEPDADADGRILGVFERSLFRDIDRLPDGATKTFDLGDFDQWSPSVGATLRAACAGRTADQRFPLAPGLDDARILTRDVDGDEQVDFIVLGRDEEEHWVLQLLTGYGVGAESDGVPDGRR